MNKIFKTKFYFNGDNFHFLKSKRKFKFYSDQAKKMFCSEELKHKTTQEIEEVKNIAEYRSGLAFLNEGKFDQAELHFKECLKILKNINQINSSSYIFVLKKYSQTLFYNKKFEECENLFRASVNIGKNIFDNKEEYVFPYHRNLIAFYTYIDISKGSNYIDELIKNSDNNSRLMKFYLFAGGAIKLLNNDYTEARQYMNKAMLYETLPSDFQGFNLHNLALLEMEENKNFKESFMLYKQCLGKLELKTQENNKANLQKFLYCENLFPEVSSEEENNLINSFTNPNSGITLTNIAESFFEKGKDFEKACAFWLKLGIKHYENSEKENIARHLIIFALFYSQLGQSLIAEGLYRKSIELLKNVFFFLILKNVMNNANYNLVFAMNMYGRLLLRQEKREKEASGN